MCVYIYTHTILEEYNLRLIQNILHNGVRFEDTKIHIENSQGVMWFFC